MTNRTSEENRIAQESAARLARELAAGGSVALVEALADAALRLEEPALRAGVWQALSEIKDQPGLDRLWAAWERSRDRDLAAILIDQGTPASAPERLRVFSLLLLNRAGDLQAAGPEAVGPLLEAAGDKQEELARRAEAVLERLNDPAARESVCRWVIESDHPAALRAALTAGYTPHDLHRRALFFLLTEQWDRYEALDFDARLLGAVYETGSGGLRARITAKARQAGWSGFVSAVAGERGSHRLADLAPGEWEVILALLGRSQRWEEAWRLAQAAPAVWSARLVRRLHEAGWIPERRDDADHFHQLAAAALEALHHGPPASLRPGERQILGEHRGLVTALAFHPSREAGAPMLISASADRSLILWQLPEFEPLRRLEGHTRFIVSLATSPQADLLASGSGDGTVRLWRLPEGRLITPLGNHAGEVSTLAFHPDGSLLASGDEVTTRLWQVPSGGLQHIMPAHHAPVSRLAFTPDGEQLISGDRDYGLYLWRLPGGAAERKLLERVAAWAIDPQGEWLATASSYGQVRMWALPGGELSGDLRGRAGSALLEAGPGGEWLAAGDRETIRLWRLPGQDEPLALNGHSRPPTALAFDPRGRALASAGQDRSLRLWDLPDGRPLAEAMFSGEVQSLVFSPDGEWLALAAGQQIFVWQVEDLGSLFEQPVRQLHPGTPDEAARRLERAGAGLAERSWLHYVRILLDWRTRYDIALEEAPPPISLGEFDIEIAA